MATVRTQHWTDEQAGDQRVRRVENWSNYQTPSGDWLQTTGAVRAASGETFLGRDLEWIADKQPLTWFVGNADQAAGRPWWGLQKSCDPTTGIVAFLPDGDASAGYTLDGPNKSISWTDVLADADLTLELHRHKIKKTVRLKTATAGEGGTGDRFTMGFVLPEGWTLDVTGAATEQARLEFKRPNGSTVFTSRPPWAQDSVELGIPATFLDRGTETLGGVEYRAIQVRIDRSTVTGWVDVDPDLVISGATDIEDAMGISGSNADKNYGGLTAAYFGNTGTSRAYIRVATSAIPAGTITAVKLDCYSSQTLSTATQTKAERFVAANVWGEGTASGAAQAGGSCWNYAAYTGTAWASGYGSGGGGASDVISETYPTVDFPAVKAWVEWTGWPTSWFEDWRDSVVVNNGVRIHDTISSTDLCGLFTTEAVSGQPYFTISYSAAAASGGDSSGSVKAATVPAMRAAIRRAFGRR